MQTIVWIVRKVRLILRINPKKFTYDFIEMKIWETIIIEVGSYFLISVSYCGEMKLGFFLSHNHLQVDIVLARNVTIASKQIPHNSSKNIQS